MEKCKKNPGMWGYWDGGIMKEWNNGKMREGS